MVAIYTGTDYYSTATTGNVLVVYYGDYYGAKKPVKPYKQRAFFTAIIPRLVELFCEPREIVRLNKPLLLRFLPVWRSGRWKSLT